MNAALIAGLVLAVGTIAGVGSVLALQDPEKVGAQADAQRVALAPSADEAPIRRSRPKLVEPDVGVAADPEDEPEIRTEPAEAPPTDDEIREALTKVKSFEESLPTGTDFTDDLLNPNTLASITGWQSSVASVYTLVGNRLASGPIMKRDTLGVAHKTAPFGTMVTFRYGGRGIRVPVIDRGPFIEGREWDLTGATAVALGFPGLGPIEWKVERDED